MSSFLSTSLGMTTAASTGPAALDALEFDAFAVNATRYLNGEYFHFHLFNKTLHFPAIC